MKLRFRLPLGIKNFWRGCRVEEKVVLCAAALIVPFCGGFEYSKGRSQAPLPPLFRAAPEDQASRSTNKILLIDIMGKVRRPGLQKLPQGSRVFQALQAAGGATDEKAAQTLNLAELLHDGQKLVVGEPQAAALPLSSTRIGQVAPSGTKNAGTKRTARKALPTAPINVNTATLEELEQLPGVGPALASRITAARAQKKLENLSDLDAVSGIGPKKLEAMRPFVRF